MQPVYGQLLESSKPLKVADNHHSVQAALKRAKLLPERDRLLIELVLRQTPLRRIGLALNLQPGYVSRRIRKLSQRLYHPVVIALMDDKCQLPPDLRQLGVERLLLGMSFKNLAAKHQLHPKLVRKKIAYLLGWHHGIGDRARLWEVI